MARSPALHRTLLLSSLLSLALLPAALQGGCTEPTPSIPGPPPTPTCTDGAKNGDETDKDCGGSCKACDVGLSCKGEADCRSGRCEASVCTVPPSCSDGKKNGDETGKDCGGSCARCAEGEGCGDGDDCVSQVCQQRQCVAAGCVDGKKNGNETDTDCGGSCGKCDADKACAGPADCLSNACVVSRCLPPAVISSITPDQGPSTGGTQLEIRGDKLLSGGDVPKVFIDGIEIPAADVVAQSAMLLRVKSPAAPGRFGPVPVKVLDSNGRQGEATMKFRYFLGNMTFADQLPSLIDNTPEAVAVADFDGDGNPDLATAHYLATKGVSVALGGKDGTFSSAIHLDSDVRPAFLVAADFDGDKKADLAVANLGSNTVTIYLGLGTGFFKARTPYTVGTSPGGLVLGDWNGDNKLDLAVANRGGTVSVLLGNGDGTFKTPAMAYSTAGQAYGIAAGLFNNDAKPDLVVTNRDKNSISVLLGNGDGTFQSPKNQDVATLPWPVVAVDLDRNGKPDLVVGSAGAVGMPSSDVHVLMGVGDGTFEAPKVYPCGGTAQGLTAADLDLDGAPDVAVALSGPVEPLVTVLRGLGDGKLEMPRKKRAGLTPYHLVSGDFNADGKPDLVAVDRGFGSALVYLNSSL